MKTRKQLTKHYAERYRRAKSKKEKSQILDDFCQLMNYNRKYASWLLRNCGKKIVVRSKTGERTILVGDINKRITRKRKKIYDLKVKRALVKVWRIMDYPCGKRLAPMLPKIVPKLIETGDLVVDDEVREKLMRISPATIDRMLTDEKKKMNLKCRSRTKPGTLLKHQIPIRTFADWEEDKAGFTSVDLVGHDGGKLKGDFCYTLMMTDIKTQWIEPIAIRNRAQVWTLEALQEAVKGFPFPVLGIDSDNDTAFINAHLLKWCEEKGITFTRSRPYKKNDNCHVEQKNWSIVRRYVGYFRYESDSLSVLNDLYKKLRLYINFFQPSMKLIEKKRVGSKVRKKYDSPKTPFERVLESSEVSDVVKKELTKIYESLNPAQLRKEIAVLQKKLFNLAVRVE